jgi:hypothetical protein
MGELILSFQLVVVVAIAQVLAIGNEHFQSTIDSTEGNRDG